jgi:hypothetical protein
VCHAGCTTTQDCTNAHDTCIGGVCGPSSSRVPQCHSNAECGSGQECVNAFCKSPCFTDADCGTCGSGNTVCNMGYCNNQ